MHQRYIINIEFNYSLATQFNAVRPEIRSHERKWQMVISVDSTISGNQMINNFGIVQAGIIFYIRLSSLEKTHLSLISTSFDYHTEY